MLLTSREIYCGGVVEHYSRIMIELKFPRK